MKTRTRKQHGLALLAFVLLLVALMVTVGMVVSGSRDATPQVATNQSKMLASAVIDQGSNFAAGFAYMLNNGSTASAITFNTAATTGLMHPTDGGAPQAKVPVTALRSTPALNTQEGYWLYRGQRVQGNNIGVTATADYALVLGGLSLETCEQINRTLYNSTSIPASGVTRAAWLGATATSTSPSDTTTATVNISAVAGVVDWGNGCVSTSDAAPGPYYVYFHILMPQ